MTTTVMRRHQRGLQTLVVDLISSRLVYLVHSHLVVVDLFGLFSLVNRGPPPIRIVLCTEASGLKESQVEEFWARVGRKNLKPPICSLRMVKVYMSSP